MFIAVCVEVALKLLCMHYGAQANSSSPCLPATSVQIVKWQPPLAGLVKLNIDVALDIENNSMIGVGVVLRDHKGQVLGFSWQRFRGCFSPQVAEALAMLRGLHFALELGINPCIVESDASNVVELVNGHKVSLSEISLIVEIQNLLARCPNYVIFES
ncbi:hypothetical protein ACOSP7_028824 [Xanthoceras sorbifolium]